jgi:two-component system, LytTR family, response regulator
MNRPLRVVIVDDEPPARALLREYLEKDERFEVVGECANGFEALKEISASRPDFVLLDIQMPKIDGFELLDLLDPRPQVIFVTAYDEYAVRAFEVHAVDYLLKPFTEERFTDVMNHAVELVGTAPHHAATAASRDARSRTLPLQRILVRRDSDIEVIPVHRIDYIEARDDSVCIVAGGARHLKQQTLAELEALLDSRRFVRVHRSYLLNVDRLTRVELYAKDSRVVILHDGTRLPVSRAGYARLRELL